MSTSDGAKMWICRARAKERTREVRNEDLDNTVGGGDRRGRRDGG